MKIDEMAIRLMIRYILAYMLIIYYYSNFRQIRPWTAEFQFAYYYILYYWALVLTSAFLLRLAFVFCYCMSV